MNGYERRRQKKAERYRRFAENARAAGEASLQAGKQMLHAAGGQPIIIGHYSEGPYRNYLKRAINKIDRGYAEVERGARWEERAEAVEGDEAISSWDPDALPKIRERIAELEAEREHIKAVNARVRKAGGLDAADIPDEDRRELLHLAEITPWVDAEKRGYPAYKLSNLSSNIRRLEQRIARIERQLAALPDGYIKAVPNKWAGSCDECGEAVSAQAGVYASDVRGEAGVLCAECWGAKSRAGDH